MKSKFFWFFHMAKITAYVHAYGNDPEEREIYKRMGEMGRTTALNRREGMSSQTQAEGLALSRSKYSRKHTSGQCRQQCLRKHEGDEGICGWTPSVWLFLSFSMIKQARFLPGIHFFFFKDQKNVHDTSWRLATHSMTQSLGERNTTM